jgi:hypothetical protein
MDPTVGPKFADAAVCECATGTGSKCDECQAFFDGGIILGQLTIPDHGVSAVPWVIMNAQVRIRSQTVDLKPSIPTHSIRVCPGWLRQQTLS